MAAVAQTAPLAESIGALDAGAAAALIGAVADIALVFDDAGIIRHVSVPAGALEEDTPLDWASWIGRSWLDVVTEESQAKVQDMVADRFPARRDRQVNHIMPDGSEQLFSYNTVSGDGGAHRVAVGKSLSSLTRLQQRLVGVQQSMERDYAQLRQYETRYRLLFQTALDALLIVQADDSRVVEANDAACSLLGAAERKLVGSDLPRWFPSEHRRALSDGLATLRIGGSLAPIALNDGAQPIVARLSLFKSGNAALVLVRLQTTAESDAVVDDDRDLARLTALVEHAPDALVIADAKGHVLVANTEFLDLTQAATSDAVFEKPLAQWLGQGGIDYQVIMASVRENGSIRLYNTQMRGEYGSVTDVEVSAARLGTDDAPCIGFSIRNISRRVAANDDVASLTPRSIDQLTQLVGRVPLKELVRESTELIEQLCIQAALKLTGNNRASAAELLGLSRQSLYVKLRRYSLADEDDPAA